MLKPDPESEKYKKLKLSANKIKEENIKYISNMLYLLNISILYLSLKNSEKGKKSALKKKLERFYSNILQKEEIFTNLLVKLIIKFSINKSRNYLITDKLKGGIKNDEISELLKLFSKKDKQKIKFACDEKMKNLICIEKIN